MRQIALLSLWTISYFVYGQDSTKAFKLGTDLSLGVGSIGFANYLPSISLSSDRHAIFIGAMLVNNVDPAQSGPLPGLQTGYQIYPNGRHKRFNLFFEYDFNFLKTKIVDETPGPSSNPYGGVKKRTIELFALDNYFCYGFRLNILKGLYFKTNVGTGFGWGNQDFIYEYWNGQTSGGNSRPYFWYLDSGFLKIGLGYDFWTIKKK